MGRLAFAHPGKIGDALYSLPTMRYVCETKKTTCDFYTSSYCLPMKRLFEYQSFIDNFFVPDSYKIARMDMGVQPWYVPIDSSIYDCTYQLGFKQVPDRAIPQFISTVVGIDNSNLVIKYDYPEIRITEPYIVIAPRGETSYKQLFQEIVKNSPIKVVQIGSKEDYIGGGINMCGLDMLETVSILSKAKGFVGLMSAMLVLANGFDIPKVIPHDGKSWDMRHVIYTSQHYYLVNPDVNAVLEVFKN